MFERFFSRDGTGTVRGMTLEWQCPDCAGLNFRILGWADRKKGVYPARCRYCKAKFSIAFDIPAGPVAGEAEFLGNLGMEDFTAEEKTDMVRDFAEIASLRADGALPGTIAEKEKALEAKIAFARRRRR